MTETATRPQLAHLTTALNELRAKGTHFRLRPAVHPAPTPLRNFAH